MFSKIENKKYFVIRAIATAGFFSLLGKANIWLNPIANTLLALCYRVFLVLTPSIVKYTREYTISICLFICSLGLFFCFTDYNSLMILGAFIFASGISIVNFFIKFETAHTYHGAAYNKISANIGSFIAALILLCTFIHKSFFGGMEVILFLLLACTSFFFSSTSTTKMPTLPISEKFDLKRTTKWTLFGIATGIKLFAIFSVMPQYIISHLGYLPYWYGMMIFINSFIIIFFQIPVMHFIGKFHLKNQTRVTVCLMIFGMCIIATPGFFHLQSIIGAIIWTSMLSIIECTASYLDLKSKKSGYLLTKEVMAGVGAGITVLLSRSLPICDSCVIIAAIGIVCLIIAYTLNSKMMIEQINYTNVPSKKIML